MRLNLNNKRKGAVSLLLMIMISILLIFGIYVYHLYDIKNQIADISYDWTTSYNDVNNQAYEAIYLIENVAFEAREQACNYMILKEYLDDTDIDESEKLIDNEIVQARISANFSEAEISEDAYLNTLNDVYYYILNARLEQLVNEVSSLELVSRRNNGLVESVYGEMYFTSKDGNASISLSMVFNDLDYNVLIDENNNVEMIENNSKLYDIKDFNLSKN
ncbi:MAG: hypothetical protein ACK5LV_07595 [Lachnospirales bacterium]